MKLRKRQPGYFGLNTTSTADISFMLLVFFLVTTSMYVDKGLVRHLPPKDKDGETERELIVDKENIMALTLDDDGLASVNDTACDISTLRARMRTFILTRGAGHLFIIDAADNCPYEAYYKVQNILSEAYKDARQTLARSEYGCPFERLNEADRTALLARLPHRVAENYHQPENAQ